MAESRTVQKEYLLNGLDCANCAMKVERGVAQLEGVKHCTVNFATTTLIAEIDQQEKQLVEKAIRAKVKQLEPEIDLTDKASTGTKTGGHGHDRQSDSIQVLLIRLAVSAGFFAVGSLAELDDRLTMLAFLAAYLVIGGEVLLRAGRNITRGQVFDENFLMALATIGAFLIGQYPEGVAVMLFYQIGELFQTLAVDRSRKSISALMDIRPDYANLKENGKVVRVAPEQVTVGALILVKPGEKVPLDGEVESGHSMVDTSALTGESVPRSVEPGSEVLSGSINTSGLLTVRVKKAFNESTVSKILDLVENASNRKAPTENFITKFARYYTPVVVIVAVLLALVPPLVVPGATFSDWVYRALIFLVISCPCALVVSIPLGFFGGIGAAGRKGILIKGSNYLEALNDVRYVVFDKTGTLTKGVFEVTQIMPQNGFTREQVLKTAAIAESHSNHPIAQSIKKAYQHDVSNENISNYAEVAGHGVKGVNGGQSFLVGNAQLLEKEGVVFEPSLATGTIVFVAIDAVFAGTIIIADEVKSDSRQAISNLKAQGIRQTVMLTGDNAKVGQAVAKELGVDAVYSELLPQDKVTQIEQLIEAKDEREKVAFVGDGINDTPVLARADVGIAMGGLGSDAAIESADIVIMTDEPSKITTAIQIAKRTRKIVWQNIVFALAVKVFFLILGAVGIATMWEAVFSDVGVTLLAVLNATRVLNVKKLS
ncbi:heavy metal translocating P-type ATPase [Listeria ilorinensis]|uniref:heavy metal translocating P-type ATPase n=1 Tax=Listeria ilorinensis TaxID=2867439 RepID=UPI001EF5E04B|nr:heavy metal translocating P-type ATPase [Listeria ilorinensis]